MPFDGKGSEGQKLAIVSVVKGLQKTTAQCVSVVDSRSQKAKTINVSWATVHAQLMTRISNGAHFWRVHAQLEVRVYTWR